MIDMDIKPKLPKVSHWRIGPVEWTRVGVIRLLRVGPIGLAVVGRRFRIVVK